MATRAGSRVLTDHDEIRQWAEEREARPSAVKRTAKGDDPGILRLDFPGYSGADSLEEISWDDFFEKFDENNLSLLVQDRTANGQRSNFNKLVSRETAQRSRSSRSRGSSSSSQSRRTAASSRGGRTSARRAGSSSRTRSSGSSKSSGSSRGSSGRKRSRPASSRKTNVRSMKRSSGSRRTTTSSGSRRRAA